MFDTQILVNGSRCKQYNHNGKTFVEAKHGSEYELEIKNTYYKRILAVCSVDGLDVLTGKTATSDAGGYIIDAYHPIKIKGFRYNDDSVGAFRFACKGGSYAASKQDGSERNCGVIGVQLYYEVEPIVVIQTPQLPPNWIWQTTPCSTSGGFYGERKFGYTSDVQYGCSVNTFLSNEEPSVDYCDDSPVRSKGMSSGYTKKVAMSPQPKGFDMGTQGGQKKDSKVYTTDFNRGCLAWSVDIYYASRESLIEMGVPITNELKVNLPQSFPGKYAEPPPGWIK